VHEAQGDGATATILLLQGSPGNPEDVLGLGARWAQRGYNVMTFNYSGTHESEGLSSFESTQLDIAAAHRYLRDAAGLWIDDDRFVLGGWSYGGGMALTYAANHSEIKTVFSISGTDHGEFMREYARDGAYRRMVDGIFSAMSTPDSPWRLAAGSTPSELLAAGGSLDAFDLQLLAPKLVDRHVLLVGGWDDHNVKIDTHVLPLYRTLRSHDALDISILALQDDHAFSNTSEELAQSVLAWVEARAGS
jgi:dienelactone hydrolase